MRIFTALLALAILALQWPLWLGKGGLQSVARMEQELAEQSAKNQGLRARNDSLDNEIKELKAGKSSVEELARSDLGMVKSGEVFFQIVGEGGTRPAASTSPEPK